MSTHIHSSCPLYFMFRCNICFCLQKSELTLCHQCTDSYFQFFDYMLSCPLLQVLLSQDELLQLSGVQCIAEVLTGHPDYGKVLLNADIAGTDICNRSLP